MNKGNRKDSKDGNLDSGAEGWLNLRGFNAAVVGIEIEIPGLKPSKRKAEHGQENGEPLKKQKAEDKQQR